MRRDQSGVTVVVVLVLLVVVLLGGLALARVTEVRTLASGNTAFREASLQASEIGLNTAYAAVRGLADEDLNNGAWYRATIQVADAEGLPQVNFDTMPEIVVGNYRVRYFAERLCTITPVTDALAQCLVRQAPQLESAKVGQESVDPPNSRQFRITVRVDGPKDTQTWIQSLVTKG